MAMESGEFRRLIEAHQRMVFSLALRVTGEHGAAGEVAQDVFLELHRGGDKLERADHIRFCAWRGAVHRATDALRKKTRQPEATAEEWMEEQYVQDNAE